MNLNNIFECLQDNLSLEAIIAFVGALAWLPILYDKLRVPVLKGKLISYHMKKGIYDQHEGLLYFLSVSMISLHNQFEIKKIKIKVKYSGDETEYSGKVFWSSDYLWDDSNGNKLKTIIPAGEFIEFISAFPKDSSQRFHVTFLVDKGMEEKFDSIKFEFYPYDGEKQIVQFNQKDLDFSLMLWDDTIWSHKTTRIGL
jgi:hypothetical protein